MVHHGVLELPAAPHLTKLDFLPADEDVGVDFDSPLDAAMADATRAAIQRRAHLKETNSPEAKERARRHAAEDPSTCGGRAGE
eukprot:2995559-Pleurochrysis_carterae.AAC.1